MRVLVELVAKAIELKRRTVILSNSVVTIEVVGSFLRARDIVVMWFTNKSITLMQRRETVRESPNHVWLLWACGEITEGLKELRGFDCVFLMESGMPGYNLTPIGENLEM